jgi:hypothetical protein
MIEGKVEIRTLSMKLFYQLYSFCIVFIEKNNFSFVWIEFLDLFLDCIIRTESCYYLDALLINSVHIRRYLRLLITISTFVLVLRIVHDIL